MGPLSFNPQSEVQVSIDHPTALRLGLRLQDKRQVQSIPRRENRLVNFGRVT
jgi:hypothetical protein